MILTGRKLIRALKKELTMQYSIDQEPESMGTYSVYSMKSQDDFYFRNKVMSARIAGKVSPTGQVCARCFLLTHFCPPLRFWNQFLPTDPTFAVLETDVSRHNGGTSGAPLKPLRDDSVLRVLSSLRGLRGATRVSPIMPRDVSL